MHNDIRFYFFSEPCRDKVWLGQEFFVMTEYLYVATELAKAR